jgi:hypothetical protein
MGLVQPSARDDQLHGLGEAHEQREAHGHPVPTHDVPAPLERAELGVLGRDPDIGQ